MSTKIKSRQVKVRGGHLGSLLCWAVIFADIGTSVYYVPGILYAHYGSKSAIFVFLTFLVFMLLAIKYTEVASRYGEGGGVVTVATRSLHPFLGLLGGLFILVDYYLTAALSALSGVIYLSVVLPALGGVTSLATVFSLLALGALNLWGIKDSARVSAVFDALAAIGQIIVVIVVAYILGIRGIIDSFASLGHGVHLGIGPIITGYAAAFLAFSGLESITQIAPAMREPRKRIAKYSMILVVLSIAVTSPLLTLWSTTLINSKGTDPNQFISILGTSQGGILLGNYVAITAAMLLVFAANTAIIGAYHVFIALARMGFLPRILEVRNKPRNTPHWSIIASVTLPVIIVIMAGGSVDLLGDLYAFGLLGAFVLTCLALDVVRCKEGITKMTPFTKIIFALGILTTLAVSLAWGVNLVAKPLATEFGGGLTIVGLIIGFLTYRNNRKNSPKVFPIHYQATTTTISLMFGQKPADILIVLPHDPEIAKITINQALKSTIKSIAFVYHGHRNASDSSSLRALRDPYLKDYQAQDAFARAEKMTRNSISVRTFIYIPGNARREVMTDLWKQIHPRETIMPPQNQDLLPAIAIGRVRQQVVDGTRILHLYSHQSPPKVI